MRQITIETLNKTFGQKQALKDVNLHLETGIHGLLGPNGAGKTTLMRCILNVIPYEGTISIQPAKESIGYLPQHFRIFPELTVTEALEYMAILKGVSRKEVPAIIQLTHLEGEKEKRIKHLSGGMLRRVGIAQTLLGDSEIIILDEPTVGVDPKERVYLRNLIEELSQDRIILLSTHIVEDVSHIADTIAFIKEGQVILHKTTEELIHSNTSSIGEITILPKDLPVIEDKYRILHVRNQADRIVVRVYSDPLTNELTPVKASLEDIYLSIVDADDHA